MRGYIAKILIFFFFLSSANAFGQEVDKVKEFIEKADFLLENNRFEDAMAMLDNAILVDPSNATLNYKKATIFHSHAKFDAAIEELKKAVEKDNNYTDAFDQLGDLYAQSQDSYQSVQYYDKAYKTTKDKEQKYLFKLKILDVLDQTRNIREMYQHIEDAKSQVGNKFDLSYYEAMYRNEVEEFDTALSLMESIIKDIKPVSGTEIYYQQYTYALYKLRKFDKVKEVLELTASSSVAPTLESFTANYHFSMAEAYFQIMDYSRTSEVLEIALSLDPALTKAFELKKQLLALKADKTKVIEAYKNALAAEKDPEHRSKRLLELAKLNFDMSNFSGAISYIEEYQNLRPANARDIKTVFMRGSAEMQSHIMGKALEQMSKIIHNPKFSPQMKVTFNLVLGMAYKNNGEFDKAEAHLKDAYAGPFRDVVKYEFEEVRKQRHAKESGNNG
ncbi:tetratricopeptide repeat protein [Limibacter armeniacum]|uniref:tetratricopeptide repeat protein n=1 Tax=Limibacter armeniacum TaxID=466084 RepID=UPI002FE58467